MRLFYEDGEERTPYIECELKNGEKHRYPDHCAMAASLLLDEAVMVGAMAYGEKTPTVLQAICNDTFYYACADSEPVSMGELPKLFDMHEADKRWGVVKWCCLQRKMRPLAPHVDRMKADGAWTDELEALPKP